MKKLVVFAMVIFCLLAFALPAYAAEATPADLKIEEAAPATSADLVKTEKATPATSADLEDENEDEDVIALVNDLPTAQADIDAEEAAPATAADLVKTEEPEQEASADLETEEAAPATSADLVNNKKTNRWREGSRGHKVTDTPEVPENHDVPEVPENHDTPEVPENHDVPEVPENHDTPEVPEIHEVPETPSVPEKHHDHDRDHSTVKRSGGTTTEVVKTTTAGSVAEAPVVDVEKKDEETTEAPEATPAELPVRTGSRTPRTGDKANAIIYAVLMLISAAGLGFWTVKSNARH